MDGTLLNDKKEIDPSFWETQRQLQERGVQLAVASGRQFYTLQKQFEAIRNDIFFISDNGAYVADKNGPVSYVSFTPEAVAEISQQAAQVPNAWLVCSGLKGGYVTYNGEKFLDKISNYYNRIEIVESITNIDDEIIKMTMCDFDDASKNSLPYFEKFSDSHNVVIAGVFWLDITPKNASKGLAVQALQEAKGISKDETMLFGDYYNDISMMPMAKYSFAMLNAQPEVKEAANYITRADNNNNGVVETLREWILSPGAGTSSSDPALA